ncbi:heavy metal translocating P-type ATPase [Stappia albiluteola]|nr:heavy metal translocating P-type ATPase [Stappia albiluteola]
MLLPTVALCLCGGGLARLTGLPEQAQWIWAAGTALVLLVLLFDIATSLLRGDFGLDLVAALAMAGALALGENLAGIIIALMFTGGEALETFAQQRARREMTALLSRVPRKATRYADGLLEDVDLDRIAPGDRVLVRRGEVVPVDGKVADGTAVLDQSALTGEALPVRRRKGTAVMSGSTNAGDAFDLLATSSAAQSTYAGIIRLVEAAQAARSPMARLADRYALVFLALTLAIAGGAWIFSGDPVRALAVLVVATPCPLILGVPVAVISGVSRCARRGILVKGGGALERLANVGTVLLDKTGTVTDGRPRLTEIRTFGNIPPLDLLRLAASLDQGSPHVVAEALVDAARERGLTLDTPSDVREVSGAGIRGRVAGRDVAVGGLDFIRNQGVSPEALEEIRGSLGHDGGVAAVVAVDGRIAGALLLADEVRPEIGTVLRQLRDAGVERIVLATGDRADIADGIASFIGVDDVAAELRPEDKTTIVERERRTARVLMVGDGVNDAPALAAADIGVAMGARGAAASSEAADAVILIDRLDRLVTALKIAARSRAIALQSVLAGIGLSVVAMGFAAAGYLTPVQGALLQEAIDVAVILNALRALGEPLLNHFRSPKIKARDLAGLEAEHQELADVVDAIRATADGLAAAADEEIGPKLAGLEDQLRSRLLPHEKHDDEEIYARIRKRSGNANVLSGMSRTHMEMQRMVHRLSVLRKALPAEGPADGQRSEILRLLYGLEAITRLHFAQEEEIYRSLEAE